MRYHTLYNKCIHISVLFAIICLFNTQVLYTQLPRVETNDMKTNTSKNKPVGITDKDIDNWGVSRWFNLKNKGDTLLAKDIQNKVVYLYCFQSWCPGCHQYGFPTLKELIKTFRDSKDVVFVAVQTVFEGYSVNSVDKAKQTADRYNLDIPIGHSGRAGQASKLMRYYKTRGTPYTIIFDKLGKIVYQDFHITPMKGKALINKLLED